MKKRALTLAVFRGALSLAMLPVVGCDKVTAPQARDAAATAQKELANGNLVYFFGITGRMGNLGNLVTGWPDARNSGLEIRREGRLEVLNAYVIENVYIPPKGMGKPIVHRALAAWPESRDFALTIAAERHPSELATDTTNGTGDYLPGPNPLAFARVHFPNPDHRWIPQSGTVLIGDPVIDRPCSTTRTEVKIFQQFVTDEVTCELALFEVRMQGEFMRADDLRSRLWRTITRHRRLAIASQQVPGIRFVTSCTEPSKEPWREPNFTVQPCYPGFNNWVRYWRHNDLFAPRLGVDVAAMSRADPSSSTGTIYGRVLPTDKEKTQGKYVRWTLHLPDGTRFDAGSFPLEYPGDRAHFPIPQDYRRDLVMSWAAPFCSPLTCGRVQAIVPACFLKPDASRYAVMVLHTEPSAVP